MRGDPMEIDEIISLIWKNRIVGLIVGISVFFSGYVLHRYAPQTPMFEHKFGVVLNVPGDMHRQAELLIRRSRTVSRFSLESSLNGSPQYFSLHPKNLVFILRDQSDVKLRQASLKIKEHLSLEFEEVLPMFVLRQYIGKIIAEGSQEQILYDAIGVSVDANKYFVKNNADLLEFVNKQNVVVARKGYLKEIFLLSVVFALVSSIGYGLMKRKRNP